MIALDAAARAVLEADARHGMYLGAFIALDIVNIRMASDLAELTRSTDEATKAILIMRASQQGDRVWPALEWLRGQRRVSP